MYDRMNTLDKTVIDREHSHEKNPSIARVCCICGTMEIQGFEVRKENYKIDQLRSMGIELSHVFLSVNCLKNYYNSYLKMELGDLPESIKLREYCKSTPRM